MSKAVLLCLGALVLLVTGAVCMSCPNIAGTCVVVSNPAAPSWEGAAVIVTQTGCTGVINASSGSETSLFSFTVSESSSSTVDAKHHIVVLQARDGEIALQEQVDFPPFLLQWAVSGSSLSYLSRALRANTKLVALDVLPRPVSASMQRENGKRSGSTRDTVRSRVLKEGDLLFFSHLGVRSGGRAGGIGGNGVEPAAQLAVHSSVEGTVEVMGCEPRTPTNSSLLTQRSGLFSAPQWIVPSFLPQPQLSANDASRVTAGAGAGYVLLAEEAMASEDTISAAQRERETADTAANHRAQTRIRVLEYGYPSNFNLRSEGLEVRVGHFRKIRSTLEVHACGGRRARIDCRSWEGADHFGSVSDSLPAKIECGRAAAL